MYVGWDDREYEDLEMDAMREDLHLTNHIDTCLCPVCAPQEYDWLDAFEQQQPDRFVKNGIDPFFDPFLDE